MSKGKLVNDSPILYTSECRVARTDPAPGQSRDRSHETMHDIITSHHHHHHHHHHRHTPYIIHLYYRADIT